MLGTQGFNRYAYVGNQPLSYVDPSGFSPISSDGWDDRDDWDWLYPGWDSCFGICDPGWFITIGDRGHNPAGSRNNYRSIDGNPFNNPNNQREEKEEVSASVTADSHNVSTADWAKVRETASKAWGGFTDRLPRMLEGPDEEDIAIVFIGFPESPVGLEQAGVRIYTSGASWAGRILTKAIYLPAWRKVTVNMAHIADAHMVGGATLEARTLGTFFPSTMNEASVLRAIREAYEGSTKTYVQGDRILLMGQGAGLKIEMWFNTVTKTIESAYPVTK
jgi:hypothetical protein